MQIINIKKNLNLRWVSVENIWMLIMYVLILPSLPNLHYYLYHNTLFQFVLLNLPLLCIFSNIPFIISFLIHKTPAFFARYILYFVGSWFVCLSLSLLHLIINLFKLQYYIFISFIRRCISIYYIRYCIERENHIRYHQCNFWSMVHNL